jgi:hypothetical protein
MDKIGLLLSIAALVGSCLGFVYTAGGENRANQFTAERVGKLENKLDANVGDASEIKGDVKAIKTKVDIMYDMMSSNPKGH